MALVDWSSNSLGTELAEYIFKNSRNALHFIDPGDVQERTNDIPALLNVIRDANAIFSINENECNSIVQAIDYDPIPETDDTEKIQEYL